MKAIILTRGRIATVDDADFDRVNQFKWYADRKKSGVYYARRNLCVDGKRTLQYMHHFIFGVKNLDHKNGDGTDNRGENVRAATEQLNGRALRRKSPGKSSQFRGVCWDSHWGAWLSSITIDGKFLHIGRFGNEEEAARAYDAKARELFGEFAAPNFSE